MPKNAQDDLFEDWATTVRTVRKNKARPGRSGAVSGRRWRRHITGLSRTGARATCSERPPRKRPSSCRTRWPKAVMRPCRLRSFIKSKLGIRSEQLLAYGIKPLRKRRSGRRKAAGEGIAN